MKAYKFTKQGLFLLTIVLAFCSLHGQAPNVTSLSFNKMQLQPYEKLEITLTLSRPVVKYVTNANRYDDTANRVGKYGFPHSDSDVIVRAYISKPGSGYYFSVNGFYNQEFFFAENNCTQRPYFNGQPTYPAQFHSEAMLPAVRPTVNDNWKIRYTPDTVTGMYLLKIAVSDKYSFDNNGNRIWKYKDTFFTVAGEPVSDGFIRILEGRKRYLYREHTKKMEYLSGAAGHFLFYANEYSCAMLEALEEYKANNINFFRIWIDGIHPWEGTRLSLVGYDKKEAAGGAVYTRIFNQLNSKRIDTLLDVFEANGIDFQICIFTPNLGDVGTDSATQYSPYYKNCVAYRTALPFTYKHPNKGFLEDPFDWYRKTHTMQKELVRYAVARWGHYTNLVSWEIGNEMYPSDTQVRVNESTGAKTYKHPMLRGVRNPKYMDDTVKNWHVLIKNYIKECDPYDHLVTTSLLGDIYGSFSDSSGEKFLNQINPDEQDYWNIPGGSAIILNKMDICNSHKYYKNPTCPNRDSLGKLEAQEEALWACTNDYINNNDQWSQLYKKPFMVQEWGWGDDNCGNPPPQNYINKRWEFDPHLTTIHNVLWLNLFSHACGLPLHFDGTLPAADLQVWKGPGGFFHDLDDIPDDAIPKLTKTASYRHSTLTWPDGSYATGWSQNKQFTFSWLYWNHPNYLKYMSASDKPTFTIGSNTVDIELDIASPGSLPRAYRVEYYNTYGGSFVYADTQFSTVGATHNILSIQQPRFMMESKMGDFAFKAKEICQPLQRFAVNGDVYPWNNTMDTLYPNDTLIIQIQAGGIGAIDSVLITEIDSAGAQVHGIVHSETFNRNTDPSILRIFSYNELPLYCAGNPAQSKRYFNIRWFTRNCENNWVSTDRKYMLWHKPPVAQLSIHDSMGNSRTQAAALGFGEPIWLNPQGTAHCSYVQYFVEQLDSSGNFEMRINTCANNNAKVEKTLLADYLNRSSVCSPIRFLPGTVATPKFYRVILLASHYRTCPSGSVVATDTCWFRVNNCNTQGNIKIKGYPNSDVYNSTSIYKPDAAILLLDSVKNATRLHAKLYWKINGIDTQFHIAEYGLGTNINNDPIDITSILDDEFSYAQNQGLAHRLKDSVLIRLDYKLSNSADGGCDTGVYKTVHLAYKRCGHKPVYTFNVNNTNIIADTLSIAAATTVYVNASQTLGSQYYSIALSRQQGGSFVSLGNQQGIWKNTVPGYNLDRLALLQPLNQDTTLYKLTLTSYSFDTSNCTQPEMRYKYIKVLPYPTLDITLKDSASSGPQRWIVYCDTVSHLPIQLSSMAGVDSVSLQLTEMYYYTNNIWGMLRIYVKPLSTWYYMRWSEYSKPIQTQLLEANSFSQYKRQKPLEKDKRWMLYVFVSRNGIVYSDTFRFYYTSACSSPPPPEGVSPITEEYYEKDSVEHPTMQEACILYPNPGEKSCIAFCKSNIASAHLMDMNGREVQQKTMAIGNNLHTFDTELLPSGVYVVTLVYGNGEKLCIPWVKL